MRSYCGEELARERNRAYEENLRGYQQDAQEYRRQGDAWRDCVRSVGYESVEAVCGPAREPPSLGSP